MNNEILLSVNRHFAALHCKHIQDIDVVIMVIGH